MSTSKSLKASLFAVLTAALIGPMPASKANAGAEPFIGEIMLVGYNFCPRGWTEADGKLLEVSRFSALFALYGTIYGGDGRTTFGLPDLRGRVPVSLGQSAGLSYRALGQKIGIETNTLTTDNMPAHNHGVAVAIQGNAAPGSSPSPAGGVPALSTNAPIYSTAPNTLMNSDMASVTETTVGSGTAVNNMQPTLVLRYCVALQGIFPSRN
ncbi:phage tail protein [Dinoroseobacter sp. S124A]|uniref:phage tail protein n=1 Tax=Dinoroseobacter sp. S124A TaxID=3415128 RepID=UPI003C7DF347